MTDAAKQRDDSMRRALLAMRQMREKLEVLEDEHAGPVAVVGMGCRYPGGVNSPDDYWRLIQEGRDAISQVPADRWDAEAFYHADPDKPGRMYTKSAGFIDNPGRDFDASFFGISPKEAIATDPQHRVMLEVCWEALENAGIAADRLMGTEAAVFLGISTTDYAQLRHDTGGMDAIDPYWGLGNSASFAAGRLAYTLGLKGPVVPVDTACSSSLVTVHMAMQALRRGECDMALAGGVNLILSPPLMIYFCKLRALSTKGRCSTFDAAADGYVRGEGSGMLVLKRLKDAQADKDNILAVLRGSAVNHAGRSGGMTIPNGVAQQTVIRRALKDSGIDPAKVGYLEAHGTGTPLGDPIEMQALAATYGKDRQQPLMIGSVKTQIGHLEAAAGVAGLSRAILALQHKKFPGHLHFNKLNPHIEAALGGRFKYQIPGSVSEWQADDGPRTAAVSSFGINGTNAHIVLEEAPQQTSDTESQETAPATTQQGAELFVLSAKNEVSLKSLGRAYQQQLQSSPDTSLSDLCSSAAQGRNHYSSRIAFVSQCSDDLNQQLQDWLKTSAPSAKSEKNEKPQHRLALLFGDISPGFEALSKSLAQRFPVFADAVQKSEQAPAFFAFQYASYCLWQSLGLRIQVVSGQGLGRAAAAVACGSLSLNDGITLANKLAANQVINSQMTGTEMRWQRAKIEWLDAQTGQQIGNGSQINWHKRESSAINMPSDAQVLYVESVLKTSADEYIASTLKNLYLAGFDIDWLAAGVCRGQRNVTLPNYPLQRRTFWDADLPVPSGHEAAKSQAKVAVLQPVWQQTEVASSAANTDKMQLLVADEMQAESVVSSFQRQGVTCEPLLVKQCLPDSKDGNALLVSSVNQDNTESLNSKARLPLLDMRFAQIDVNESDKAGIPQLLAALKSLPENATYWLAVQQAYSVSGDEMVEPQQAAMAAMLLSLQAERPDLQLGLIDVGHEPDLSLLAQEIMRSPVANQVIAYHRGQRFVRQTDKVAEIGQVNPQKNTIFHADKSYLVTGGLGGVGSQLVRWLVQNGAENIIIPSRSGADDKRFQSFADLKANIQIASCDITDAASLQQVVTQTQPALAGVFHAAGIVKDGLLAEQTQDAFDAVMAVKLKAAECLDESCKDMPLEHFVLFGSMTGFAGSAGQSNYAAANAALAALCQKRHTQGKPALCIHWGLWDGLGMAAKLGEQDRARLARKGIQPMPPPLAFEALGGVLIRKNPATNESPQPEYLMGSFIAEEQNTSAAQNNDQVNWAERIKAAAPEQQADMIQACLLASVSQVLSMPEDQISQQDNLFELGFDSLMVMDLAKLIKQSVGCPLYPREIYQAPVVGDLASLIHSAVADSSKKNSASDQASPNQTSFGTGPDFSGESYGEKVSKCGFILSAPRSGSTLLRAMLSAHSELFVPPELHLLPFKTMAERATSLADSHLDEGLIRAVMELRDCDADSAKQVIQQWIDNKISTQTIYQELQQSTHGQWLIDKSPSYAMHSQNLTRAENLFHDARYIYLVRHPYAMIDSFMQQRMDKLIGQEQANPFQLAEKIWCGMNRNILAFRDKVGHDRCLLLRYEDLVTEPEKYAQQVTDFMGIPLDPAILKPYSHAKMTDGISDRSLSIGDPNYGNHKDIDASLATSWQTITLPGELSQDSISLANELGYELPEKTSAAAQEDVPYAAMTEELITVQGLDLTLCRWGEVTAPAVVCLHGILEQGAVFQQVANHLVSRGYQVIAPDLRGHGKSAHISAFASYQLGDFAADLDGIMQHLQLENVTLLGLSLGAAIATFYTVAKPEKINQLILVEPPYQREASAKDLANTIRAQFAPQTNTSDVLVDNIDHAAKRLAKVYPGIDQQQCLALAERGTAPDENGKRHWRWDKRLRMPASVGFALSGDLLGQITVPYRLVFGEKGELLSARDWKEVGGEQLVAVDVLGGGHNLHVELAGELVKVVKGND